MYEFPYILAAFLDREPEIGEPVFYGKNGWYVQVALKRRFKVNDISEEELISRLEELFNNKKPFTIKAGELVKVDLMPVKSIEVEKSSELMQLHKDIFSFLGDTVASRFPERDGENYFPHITAEYKEKPVIDVDKYKNKEFTISKIYLLKDINDQNSIAYKSFNLAGH